MSGGSRRDAQCGRSWNGDHGRWDGPQSYQGRPGRHVWNRSLAKARPLADEGAKVAADAADAVSGADVVVTMLFDADAIADVMGRALPATPEHAVWAQTSTVGLAGTQHLAKLAGRYGRGYVDAPVLGTKQPAEQGQLIVLAAGPRELEAGVAPVFEAIGSKTVWVGNGPVTGTVSSSRSTPGCCPSPPPPDRPSRWLATSVWTRSSSWIPPRPVPVWPLWFAALAFVHLRVAGPLLALGLAVAAIVGI